MLLTLSTTRPDATDLGYLLHKHPQRVQIIDLPWGTARVFYPDRDAERCTVALHVEVDPVAMVRDRGLAVEDYVNDRPWVASSFLSVALSRCFGTAISGRCAQRPELVDERLPLTIELPAVAARGGVAMVRRMFAPLGYTVETTSRQLEPAFPEWGAARVLGLRLTHVLTVRDALRHLYVLLPVLDDDKHYFVEQAEADKLVRLGEGWLAEHPDREEIARRYLKRQGHLVRNALADVEPDAPPVFDETERQLEERPGRPVSLNELRHEAVHRALVSAGARRVLDLGCGEARLLRRLADDQVFTQLCGVDVSQRALEIAARRLRRHLDADSARVALRRGGLSYRDPELRGWDAACLIEVIEHIDEPRLPALVDTVFGDARPATVVITTPNVEYNVLFEGMQPGAMRHRDHRFEWTRETFRAWAENVATRHGYTVAWRPIGEEHPTLGPPTQMAIFSRTAESSETEA